MSMWIQFWIAHPALFYGLSFLLGIGYNLDPFLLIFPCICLWVPLILTALKNSGQTLKPLFLSVFVFLTAWDYSYVNHSFPLIPEEGQKGLAQIKIKSLCFHHSHFGARWIYRCELLKFIPEHQTTPVAFSIPCLISMPEHNARALADQDYWIKGKLIKSERGTYVLKVSKNAYWSPVKHTYRFAEKRFQAKQWVAKWIELHVDNPSTAAFLSGLATGEYDDAWMRHQFSRFGLQHLLAISGFHFAITASFLSFILSFFLPLNLKKSFLIFCLGLYCLFLGPQPSVLRAWAMCTLTLVSGWFKKRTTALNSLGLAMLGILIYDPLICQEVGFQLSFGTTTAILLFYSPINQWLEELLPKRKLSEVIKMNSLNQHGYCVLAFIRGGLALGLSVNLFALPMTLYYFNQFPIHGILYNLFFPFFTSISMCLLMSGALFSFIPHLAEGIHALNNHFTTLLLQLTYQIPSEIDLYLTTIPIMPMWLIAYLCIALLIGIWWQEKNIKAKQESFNFI